VLARRFLADAAAGLDATAVAALAPAVAFHTADGRGSMVWVPGGVTPCAALTDPRSIPHVLIFRRDVWDSLDGFDESLLTLVEYEFWLRLLLAGHAVRVVNAPLVSRELEAPRAESGAEGDQEYLQSLRDVLDRHAGALSRHMRDVLVAREVRFGELRRVHRELTALRDAELAELDRIRSEAAHGRAYLEHHQAASLDWGDLRRSDPISRDWGYDRGVPVDRRYIEDFLAAHSSDIGGAVLEVQEDDFTRAFGGPRVTERAVLDVDPRNPRATVVADLRCAREIASERFDCIILTQTLHVIDDMHAALRECSRLLRPDGVLLATFPAASRVCLEYGEEGDFWRMTPAGARALVQSAFGPAAVVHEAFGSVLTNVAFLHGVAREELTDAELEARDPYFPALTGVRARKVPSGALPAPRGAVLLYHRLDAAADAHGLSVPPVLFEAHLRWLKEQCHVMPLEQMLRTPASLLPDRAIAMTFDDGYVDSLGSAAPMLEQYGLPATFFVTSGGLDRPEEYWWDTLERVLLGTGPVPDAVDLILDGKPERIATASAADRVAAHWRIHPALVHASLEDRNRAIAALLAWSGGGAMRYRPMSADEVRELAARPGAAVGAHTVNHLALPDQPAHVRRREIEDCRAALARILETSIDLFAYPYGAVDRASAASVRESWRWGLSCDELALADSFDAARVPRIDVKPWAVAELAGRLDRLFRSPAGLARNGHVLMKTETAGVSWARF
jgi:peptidoglycan/xylan/chitin deacetylase (PgdA/CDA1 family)